MPTLPNKKMKKPRSRNNQGQNFSGRVVKPQSKAKMRTFSPQGMQVDSILRGMKNTSKANKFR